MAATPHPEKTIVDKNIAVVGVLNQPIIWDTHRINLVILVNLKRDYNQELESFYQKTTNLLFNHKKVAALIRNPTFTNFMTLLSN
ncbi:PTS sugar transporter subunit IIA [Enterococcus sp. 12F9_DIV0723]|uniref:PTS sugar transporter subunit IIA n=1 Tax=Enterococcus sp. 12F9_DIV0723 TaxID=1834169 RepID=UPI0034E889C7